MTKWNSPYCMTGKANIKHTLTKRVTEISESMCSGERCYLGKGSEADWKIKLMAEIQYEGVSMEIVC